MNTKTRFLHGKPTSPVVARTLVGLGLTVTAVFPVVLLVGQCADVVDILEIVEEMERFFGSLPAAILLLVFMAAVPCLGIYVMVSALRRATARRDTAGIHQH